ncbi:AP-1 complex subunit gamma Ecym_8086 [Eremothecium cymbalariae DBVPG|uniref:AP-1 complex subunit gamma n=1 Tax=Eremothecium cymbalariae (strain CBS 270.75 / DBVPG 7215 / KCTC 17166 / NRRL Y-17582) TaxID=931890 RepID=G8JX07_ERECY|nr:Hypothetical protein Ecym_8086 [Eremothecium cymbalariae DBVPG\
MGSLRTFIKDVRAAKTLAEERSMITKESAKIRTRLKDDHLSLSKRRKNIQKLLYLYILGEKTHFAQVECINLIASDEFENKRLGYLAAMLLLDEKQELLTLLTNILKSDINHPTKYVVSMVLCTLGTLTSVELARDLYPDVEQILKFSKDRYLLKKAFQCAAKIVIKDPYLASVFHPYTVKIFSMPDVCTHGVLLGVNQLLQSMATVVKSNEFNDYDAVASTILKVVPELLGILKQTNSSTLNTAYDVHGVCDPFLQVETLYTLRLIFLTFKDEVSSYNSKFTSILGKMVTNVESSKNSANAILYEIVRTVFTLESQDSLRVQSINILAKFLSGKDINTKYVALNSLLQVVSLEPQAVQTHRKFISRCLFDPDISIQKRALELIFNIIEDSNMKETVDELVNFITLSDGEERDLILYTVEHLLTMFDIRGIKSKGWTLAVVIRILKSMGEHLTVEIIGEILVMINNATELSDKRDIALQLLQLSLSKDQPIISEDNFGWKLITVWIIGEYANLVLGEPGVTDISLTGYLNNLNNIYSDDHKLIGYILTAALKLSSRISDPGCIEKLRQLVKAHEQNTDLVIQTKAVHYSILFSQPKEIKTAFLEAMPVFIKNVAHELDSGEKAISRKPVQTDLLGDLLSDIPSEKKPVASISNKPGGGSLDLLLHSFTNKNPSLGASAPLTTTTTSSTSDQPVTIPNIQISENIPSSALEIHTSSAIQVFSHVESANQGSANIRLFFKAKSSVTQLAVLVAVSKTQKLNLGTISRVNMIPGQVATQLLTITGSGILKFRIKLSSQNGINLQFDHKFDTTL